jgi:hypothetical protein
MKILVITSINPVLAGDVYVKVAGYFEEKNQQVDIICFPFFAEIEARTTGKNYLASLFAMMGASLKPDLHNKIYRANDTIVVGNCYKDEKFDIVVSYDDIDGKVFDSYVAKIKQDVAMKEFAEMARVNDLYTPEDASIHLPTLDHLNLFLSSSFDEPRDQKMVA